MILEHAGDKPQGSTLNRRLGVVDLTSLGIAAIIGAGIFSTIGTAASYGGPAVSLLFYSLLLHADFQHFATQNLHLLFPSVGVLILMLMPLLANLLHGSLDGI